MPNPRATMKRKKQQSIQNIVTIKQYIIDILIILDYEGEYLPVYVNSVQILRQLRQQDSSYSLSQYYEMLQQHPDTVDLGSRYEYLIKMVDLLIDCIELETKFINTLL